MRSVPLHVKQRARDLLGRIDRSQQHAWEGYNAPPTITKRDTDAIWYLIDLVDADVSGDLAAQERERYPLISGRARRRVNPS